MQLPTSVTATPYTPSNTSRVPQTSPANKPANGVESSSTPQERARQPTQSAVPPQTKEVASTAFSSVEQANKVESSNLEAAVKRSDSSRSSNPAINNYLQMSKEGAPNAQDQDSSLFRVDVYV